jgi:hypothetical protein
VNVIVVSSTLPPTSCATARSCTGPCEVGSTDISKGAVEDVPTAAPLM